MEKRIDKKKKEKQQKKQKHKFILATFLCVALFVGSICITDRAVSRLIMSEENKRALGVEINNESSVVNVEIAGEIYSMNVEGAKDIIDIANQHIKNYYQEFKSYIESKK